MVTLLREIPFIIEHLLGAKFVSGYCSFVSEGNSIPTWEFIWMEEIGNTIKMSGL